MGKYLKTQLTEALPSLCSCIIHHLVSQHRKISKRYHGFLADGADADEPPRSDAGQDVVIQLPTDWAILDGRDSVDDHEIRHYEWTLVRGDTAINMKVGVIQHHQESEPRNIRPYMIQLSLDCNY